MELSWLLVFKIGASLAGVIAGMGMFSGIAWPVKLKVVAALLVGIILIGFLAPLGPAAEPFGVISVPAFGGAAVLIGLAVLTGFISYFISWPNGRDIGILAVPAGLAVWAVRGGNMEELTRLAPTLAQRQAMFAAIKWEPIFWLAIVAAGFGGVLIGQYLVSRASSTAHRSFDFSPPSLINRILAVACSGLIAQFCIGIFAQDIRIPDLKLSSVVAQPAVGQIAFAVLVSFGIAAFLVKNFLDAGYIWPIAASALVTGFAVITCTRESTLQYLVEHYPPVFFAWAVTSILPLQIVAFGTLGSIAGYWTAVRVNFRLKHTQTE